MAIVSSSGRDRVSADAEARGIPIEFLERVSASSLEEAASIMGIDPSAIVKSLEAPAVRSRLLSESLDPMSTTPAAFADFIVKDIARYEKIVKATGAKPE